MFKDDEQIRIFFDNSDLRYWVPIKKSIIQKFFVKDPSTKHFKFFHVCQVKLFALRLSPKNLGQL
jgi:hypothetical protein